jgi:hypothetical protein
MTQMRTVIVQKYLRPRQATEYGRAILNPDGSVTVHGFQSSRRHQWTRQGIYDFQAKRFVPLTEGNAFLDALLKEFKGGYVRAVEQSAGADVGDTTHP